MRISGNKVNDHIRNITPDANSLPTWYMDKLISPREFELKKVRLKELLNSDPDFKDYFDSNEVRYDNEDHLNLDHALVVVDGELLDGYSRASEMIRNGEEFGNAFVALQKKITEIIDDEIKKMSDEK